MTELIGAESSDASIETEPASFRDPTSRVFYRADAVFRGLDRQAAADFEALSATRFFRRLIDEKKVVATERSEPGLDVADNAMRWQMVLRHERIPFVSYPYEWAFAALRDAAELHLEILLDALAEGMTMKDGSAFNVQWKGSQPVFIDVPSFERSPDGGPWAGYRQFCQTFLYPLLLQAHKGVPFQTWFRGSVDGFRGTDIRRLMGLCDLFRPGVMKHVVLHTAMESRISGQAQEVESELHRAGFGAEITQALGRSLLRLVRRLERPPSRSPWSGYRRACTYTDHDQREKEAFLRRITTATPVELVWDLGCNDGHYARVVAEHARYVVALDNDEAVVDRLYRTLRREGNGKILPLVMDLRDPSPALGWRASERRSLTDRGTPDLVLCLALVHHLAISANIPLASVIAWIRSLDAPVVIEFVGRGDEMVKELLANKASGQHADYREDLFEELLARSFTVERRQPLPSGTRTMYLAKPRA